MGQHQQRTCTCAYKLACLNVCLFVCVGQGGGGSLDDYEILSEDEFSFEDAVSLALHLTVCLQNKGKSLLTSS